MFGKGNIIKTELDFYSNSLSNHDQDSKVGVENGISI